MEFRSAEWIWIDKKSGGDEYAEFFDCISYSGGTAIIGVSCCNNYALYVNGELAAFGQYADYPWYKVYDEIDITKLLKHGKNSFRMVVWHYGDDGSSVSYADKPCLIYEVQIGGNVIAYSSVETLCREAAGYVSGRKKKITPQLGYSFCYDTGDAGGECGNAVKVEERGKFTLRPVERLTLEALTPGKLIDADKRIYDLGRECAGLLYVRFRAPKGGAVTVSFGEHIADGQVRRIIGRRDFSVEVIGDDKTEEYLNPFRRLGCRYLQVDCDKPCTIEEIGIRETPYPVTVKPFNADTPLRQSIYDTAVRTLQLCMHEHYEDTPWREQALYALDSRNQMLFGYYTFKDGNFRFARANLKLIGEDRRDDGLLSICYPSSFDLAIPSFSLYYIIAMLEYAEHSGDDSLLREYATKLKTIIDVFCAREENGLIVNFYGTKRYWNFYEWSDGLDGSLNRESEKEFDLILNSLFLYALQSYIIILKERLQTDVEQRYFELVKNIKTGINKTFFNPNTGLYRTRINGNHYSELGNALAVLCGAADAGKADVISKQLISDNDMIKTTLSMRTFKYDALRLSARYQNDISRYDAYILSDIDNTFSPMLDESATSFWETEKGEADFDGAGSLCHGWSAAPAYYYRLLKESR